jgi:hypothetical protein
MIHNIIVFIPTERRLNIIAFTIGMMYFIYSVKTKYGEVRHELVISLTLSCFWFLLCNIILHFKFKTLYGYLLKCEKMMKETKKILQIFPHGVIITKDEGDKNECFTNHEFNKKI